MGVMHGAGGHDKALARLHHPRRVAVDQQDDLAVEHIADLVAGVGVATGFATKVRVKALGCASEAVEAANIARLINSLWVNRIPVSSNRLSGFGC